MLNVRKMQNIMFRGEETRHSETQEDVTQHRLTGCL